MPTDVQQIMKHWCFVLRPEVTKGKRLRRVPIHKHLVEQGFLEYVEERRKIGKPLFYEPARARGGKGANPQWQKVAERLGEWVHGSLKLTDVQPNHGWRHLWREIVRGTKMKPELCDYMCGTNAGVAAAPDTASARSLCLPRRCRSFLGSKCPRWVDRRHLTSVHGARQRKLPPTRAPRSVGAISARRRPSVSIAAVGRSRNDDHRPETVGNPQRRPDPGANSAQYERGALSSAGSSPEHFRPKSSKRERSLSAATQAASLPTAACIIRGGRSS
jgi:hypothetical protein